MTERVSQSHTGQNRPKPSREERDAASSSGAGRAAVEDPVKKQRRTQKDAHKPGLGAPIGTDLETKAEEASH